MSSTISNLTNLINVVTKNEDERPALGLFYPHALPDVFAARLRFVEDLFTAIIQVMPNGGGLCNENLAMWGQCFAIAFDAIVASHKDARSNELDHFITVHDVKEQFLRCSKVLDTHGSTSWLVWGRQVMPDRYAMFVDTMDLIAGIDENRRLNGETWSHSYDLLTQEIVGKVPSVALDRIRSVIEEARFRRSAARSLSITDGSELGSSTDSLVPSNDGYSPTSFHADLVKCPPPPPLVTVPLPTVDPRLKPLPPSPLSLSSDSFSSRDLNIHPPSLKSISSSSSSSLSSSWYTDGDVSDTSSNSSMPKLSSLPTSSTTPDVSFNFDLRQVTLTHLPLDQEITKPPTCGNCSNPMFCYFYIFPEDLRSSAFCTCCLHGKKVCIGRVRRLHEEQTKFYKDSVPDIFHQLGEAWTEWYINHKAKSDVLRTLRSDVEEILDVSIASRSKELTDYYIKDSFMEVLRSSRIDACIQYLNLLEDMEKAHKTDLPNFSEDLKATPIEQYYNTISFVRSASPSPPAASQVCPTPASSPTSYGPSWLGGDLVESPTTY
ncbi:hypothetical protein DL96DRAFT_1567247 [Flagelloscypha sp. PMI_526]|nr:hypothetical protein DL96DRAFT_1567247 [Flagelloscypha sp. PMI_526]